ncbi:MAG TPA: hypothetical protein VKB69_00820 [Micromonosporaceae bacterium]|nr:hypothetical protein [Micromonosporaceae bacterium]
MGPGTLLLVVIAGVVAFLLGYRWHHHSRSRADYRVAVSAARKSLQIRRAALRAVVIVAVLCLAYFVGVVRLTMTGQDDSQKPAGVPHTVSPSPTPRTPAHPSESPQARK